MSGHISLLLPDLRAGGAQRVFLILARAFLAKGIRVDIVVGLAEGSLLAEVPPGARLLPLCTRLPMFGQVGLAMMMLLRLVRYLRQHQPDTLLSTLSGTNIVAAIARRIVSAPTKLVLREACRFENLPHSLYITIMRCVYRWADIVVALTPEMQSELEDVLGLSPDRIVQIPNPVDIERLIHGAKEPLPDDFDPNNHYLLAVGRLSPQKDIETLIRAFSQVAQIYPVNLVILGEGPDRSKIEAQIQTLALKDRVNLRGFDANPYRWMVQAEIFVLSSRWEGYPNVIIEALSLNLPVVTTEYDHSAHALVHEHGEVVPIGDADALANAILSRLTSKYSEANTHQEKRLNILENNLSNQPSLVFSNNPVNKYLEVCA